MPNRRDFFRSVAGATAGAFALGSGWTGVAGLLAQAPAAAAARSRSAAGASA